MRAFSVTEAVVGWLGDLGYSASSRVPAGAADTFVTVERVGGGPASWVDRATLAVQVWAPTEDGAEGAANELRLRLLSERPPSGIHSVRVQAGPYPFFDDHTRCPRYQLVLDVAAQLVTADRAERTLTRE